MTPSTRPIITVGRDLGLDEDVLTLWGEGKAKVSFDTHAGSVVPTLGYMQRIPRLPASPRAERMRPKTDSASRREADVARQRG